MTPEELAATLNGRQYLNEISRHEISLAIQNGLTAAFGCGDDTLILRGAIEDDPYSYGSQKFYFYNGKLITTGLIRESKEVLAKFGIAIDVSNLPWIETIWADKEINASWHIKTSFPSVPFDVMEDDNLFCRGAIFRSEDIK